MKNKINMKVIIFTFGLCFMLGFSFVSSADTPYKKSIGWIHGNCIAIYNQSIPNGTEIDVVSTRDLVVLIKAKILEKVTDDSQCSALSADRKSVNIADGSVGFYMLSADTILDLGIGIIKNPDNKFEILDINRDGVNDKFHTCTSSEGIHFKISDGTTNILIWSGYYYLGYDIESNCP